MLTDINSEDRLVQETFANHLRDVHGWENIFAYNDETFGPNGLLGRANDQEVVLKRDLRAAIQRLNPLLPPTAVDQALSKLTTADVSRSLLQHNRQFYSYIRNGVPVEWRDEKGHKRESLARVIDFDPGGTSNNRFLVVRELWLRGLSVPHYHRRADVVCFVNGLPLVFIELKRVDKNMRTAFDQNITDYLSPISVNHVFHHNAFIVVSNGDRARYGSITSKWEHYVEWKREDETQKGSLEAVTLLDGMLAKNRLLDIVQNFILYDDSKPGGTRKVVARNHQVLGVNNAVASVQRQEDLKRQFPPSKRLIAYAVPDAEIARAADLPTVTSRKTRDTPANSSYPSSNVSAPFTITDDKIEALPLVQRAHPDLGRLGVFWHTQGSGKSYSMVLFSEKVRRTVPGNFTFVIMTDREDLDDQIWDTFVGCGIIDPKNTPRATSGRMLRELLQQNHRFIFTLIHKFNQPVNPDEPYSTRDDIIVISDEAHRTQAGKFARNMRLALPNASFIGFTGTPIFKYDHLTKRIFGGYISRYDFKRSEEDHSTVKLVYENRGEKLGIAKLELNDRIAEKIEGSDLDQDQTNLLDRLLGKDYEVITASDRLNKLAIDFVDHCSARWQSGKSMLVCIDKVTCGRMLKRIQRLWKLKQASLAAEISRKQARLSTMNDKDELAAAEKDLAFLHGQAGWMKSTIIELIISEAQNEARDFMKWGINIIPHRVRMKNGGFELPGGKTMKVDEAFKDPQHPFRIAIVCAMWLTGFDVECLQTLYIDKPMKAHTLMQAIARANRIYPGKTEGLIVDYNGMLKSLRAALAQYGEAGEGEEPVDPAIPIEKYVQALANAIDTAEAHLRSVGFDPTRLVRARGFDRIAAIRDAADAVQTTDETQRRFEIMAREIFSLMKALILHESARPYYIRHDDIEAIYNKLQEKRDTADVTDVLKEIHKIVNDAIRAHGAGADQAEGLRLDLTKIDFQKLRDEFARKVTRKNATIHDIRELIEKKLREMLARNPTRMDYYKKYQEIVADYNREKDRVTVEETFAHLAELAAQLDSEQTRHVREGLSEEELTFFDMLLKKDISKADREALKQASKQLLTSLKQHLAAMPLWYDNTTTQADVQMFILDSLYNVLPRPPFSEPETNELASRLYGLVWQQSRAGNLFAAAA